MKKAILKVYFDQRTKQLDVVERAPRKGTFASNEADLLIAYVTTLVCRILVTAKSVGHAHDILGNLIKVAHCMIDQAFPEEKGDAQ